MTPTRRSSPPTPRRARSPRRWSGADVFVGLSVGGVVTPGDGPRHGAGPDRLRAGQPRSRDRLRGGARGARRTPSWPPAAATIRTRSTTSSASRSSSAARSTCRATDINDAMKLAAVQALAELASEDVPDAVLRAYGVESLRFGREYLIPKPFDYRVLLRVPPAVARAADGDRRGAGADRRLRRLPPPARDADLAPRCELMHGVFDQAKRDPEADRLPRGRAREDPARRQDPGRRGDRPSDPARPPRGDRRPPARPRPPRGRS